MSYKQQSIRYLPYAYWDINGNTSGNTESTAFGNNITLTKSAGLTKSNRSIIYNNYYQQSAYSDSESSVILTSASDSLTVPMTNINWGKSGYAKKPFTINFCFQEIYYTANNNRTSSIFNIGSNIKLYFTGDKFYLKFLNRILWCPIENWKKLFMVSIVYDGNDVFLMVDGKSGTGYGTVDTSLFESSPSMLFTGINSYVYQVNGLAIYNFAMSSRVLEYIYRELEYQESFESFNVSKRYKTMYNEFDLSSQVSLFEADSKYMTFRNIIFKNNKFILPTKAMSVPTTTGITYSSTGASFSSTGHITVPSSDLNSFDCKITVEIGSFTTLSGTLFEINSSVPIRVSGNTSSGLVVYNDGVAIGSAQVMTGETKFSLIFSGGGIYCQIGTGAITSLNSTIKSSIFDSIILGNRITTSYASPFNTKISSFSINYYNNPLTVGKYYLDLNNDFVSLKSDAGVASVTKIKAKQDGVATLSASLPNNFNKTILEYEYSGDKAVMSFLDTDTYSESNWYNGTQGTSISPGRSVRDSANSVVVGNNDGGIVKINMSVLLTDSELGIQNLVRCEPWVSNLTLRTFMSPKIYSQDSIMSMSSADPDAIGEFDYQEVISKRWSSMIRVFTDSNIVISDIDPDTRTISMLINFRPTPAGGDIFTLDGTTTKITMSNITSTSFSLSTTNAGGIFVDGRTYTPGSTLYFYNSYLITIYVPSQAYTTATFKNIYNSRINYFGTAHYTVPTSEILQQSAMLFSKVKNSITDSGYPTAFVGTADATKVTAIAGYSIVSS